MPLFDAGVELLWVCGGGDAFSVTKTAGKQSCQGHVLEAQLQEKERGESFLLT